MKKQLLTASISLATLVMLSIAPDNVAANTSVQSMMETSTSQEKLTQREVIRPTPISVLFPDKDLAKMVALELTLESDDKYTLDSLVTQAILDMANDLWSRDGIFDVKSLEGIGYLHNLNLLYLDGNSLTNIPSELAQLPLTQIDLTSNEISDMRVLNHLSSNVTISAGYQIINKGILGEFTIGDNVSIILPTIFEQATDPDDILFSNNLQPIEIIQGPEGTYLDGTTLYLPTNTPGTYTVRIRINGGVAHDSLVVYTYTVSDSIVNPKI